MVEKLLQLRVLVIEDDDDDFLLLKKVVKNIPSQPFQLTHQHDQDTAFQMMIENLFDCYLVDYRLGGMNGLELIQLAKKNGMNKPVIILTGQGDVHLSIQAIRLGVDDYLIKNELTPQLIERSIRYAIERRQALEIQNQLVEQRIEQENFKRVAETIPQLVWVVLPDGTYSYFNDRWLEFCNDSIETLKKNGWNCLLHPDDQQVIQSQWAQLLKSKQPFELELRLKHVTTGDYHWFICRSVPVKDTRNKIIRWIGTFTDINKQKMSEYLVHAVLNSLRSHIAVLDRFGTISDVNSAWTQFAETYILTEEGRAQVGTNYLDYLNSFPKNYNQDAQMISQGIRAVINGEREHFSAEYCFNTSSKKQWFLIQVVQLKHFGGGVVVSHTNITQRKLLEQQKDEFIGIASHELKTPVTSIKAYCQVLQQYLTAQPNSEAKPLLNKMNIQINKMTTLITDLLDVTKIQAGKLQLKIEQIDFDQLVREIVETTQLTTTKHTIEIIGATNAIISADSERVSQVITNLLSNAVKYSPKSNRILVKLSSDTNTVHFSVTDYGVGISKEKQLKVFERFYRGTGPQSVTYPGLGLGLYISSEIIHRLQGNIGVESDEGRGSTFYFSLPKVAKDQSAQGKDKQECI